MASPGIPSPPELYQLTAEDLAQLHEVLRNIMQPDNAVIASAEAVFQSVKDNQPAKLCVGLLTFATGGGAPEICNLAAILLRRILSSKDTVWDRIADIQAYMKQALIAALQSITDAQIRKRMCDIVSLLGTSLIPHGTWQDLLPTLFQMATAEAPEHREAALIIFGDVSESAAVIKGVLPHIDLFHKNLQPENPLAVRVAAMKAASSFVVRTDTKTVRNAFKPLAPAMIDTFNCAIQAQSEEVVDETVEIFIELADNQPLFFKQTMAAVFQTVFTMAKSAEWLSDNTRFLALEFLLSMAENAPNMIKKVADYLASCVQLATEWTTIEEEKDLAEWNQEGEESSSPMEVTFAHVGADALDRISLKMGGSVVLPIVSAMLPTMMAHPSWNVRVGAMVTLCHIGEGCSQDMQDDLENIVNAVVKMLDDQHAMVRHAACVCLAQFGLDFLPAIQMTHHAIILPALVRVMQTDAGNPRVVAHAAAAVINMVRAMDIETLEPYVDVLLTMLAQLLQYRHRQVLQHAITGVAAMSIPMGEHFARYYDQFMPYIKSVICNAQGRDLRLLRGKAMECASMIGLAVGAERFLADAHEIMDLLVQIHAAAMNSAEEELNLTYLHKAYTRILQLMGADFAKYLPVVMPGLLKSAQIEPDVSIVQGDIDAADLDGWDVFQAGGQYVVIHTSALEEKSTACQMLYVYAQELKEGILPWVSQIQQVIIPLLKFVYDADVRSSVLVTLPELVRAVTIGAQKGTVPLTDASTLVALVLPKMLESIQAEPNIAVLYDGSDALKELVAVCGPGGLTEEQVKDITESAVGIIVKMANEMAERAARDADEDADDLAGGADSDSDDEEANEEDVISEAQSVFSQLIKTMGPAFFPFYENIVAPSIRQLEEQNAPEECKWVGLCAMDDLIEFCSPDSHPYLPIFMPVLMENTLNESGLLRQAAIYGVGVAAEKGGDVVAPFIPDTIQRLVTVIQAPNSRFGDNEQVTDNAISALGKILLHCGMGDAGDVVKIWMDYLPLKGDEVEDRATMTQLCAFIDRSNPHVLGPDGANTGRIVVLLSRGLNQMFKSDQEDEKKLWETQQRPKILATMTAISTAFPAVFQQAWGTLTAEEKSLVQEQQALAQRGGALDLD